MQNSGRKGTNWTAVITAIIGIVGVVLGASVAGYFQVKSQKLSYEQSELQSVRKWKKQSVSNLLGPVNMQLERTKRAFDRWTSKNLYLEAKIIREGNITVRDLLLTRGHLIPPDLLEDAHSLVEHYDRWLEEFDRKRDGSEPDLKDPFVFVGPEGYPFPSDAAQHFKDRFNKLWTELYAEGSRIP